MMRLVIVGAAMLSVTNPSVAAQYNNGLQIIENFEARALGPTSINFCTVSDPAQDCLGTLSGGAIAATSAAFPDAGAGSLIYTGTLINFIIG